MVTWLLCDYPRALDASIHLVQRSISSLSAGTPPVSLSA